MIDTLNSKAAHYVHGCHTLGSGPEVVTILGSCRVVPYMNYFEQLNSANRFTIHLIDVVHFYGDEFGKRVDAADFVTRFETNEFLIDAIKKTKWFIHEHTVNFGMFNTASTAEKNIYHFGMNPESDISIPNFNDIFILFQELVNLDANVGQWARSDVASKGTISREFVESVKQGGLFRIGEFLEICELTSLPEMADLFRLTWRTERYWWTGNHISNKFTIAVFRMMNEKFLHIQIPDKFWGWCDKYDAYCSPRSPITKWDVMAYGLNWPQPIEELKL